MSDVKARLADGRQVIIEMQVLNVAGFEQRILLNAAKSYSMQLQKLYFCAPYRVTLGYF